MLEYEEELALSDLLVARRSVLTRLKESGTAPNRSERKVISDGDRAAASLAEAYLPFIRKSASMIYARVRDSGSSTLEFEDLVAEGVVAAIRTAAAFNARGTGERRGVRFATYAGRAITKAMNRHVAKESTPMYVEVAAIQATWTWRAVQAELTEELGRIPTDDEISERSGINAAFAVPSLPGRSSIANVDDPESTQVADRSDVVIALQSEHDYAAVMLKELFQTILTEDLPDVAASLFGLDSMQPRDAAGVAQHLGISRIMAKRKISIIENILSHPRYRVWARMELQQIDPEGTFAVSDDPGTE